MLHGLDCFVGRIFLGYVEILKDKQTRVLFTCCSGSSCKIFKKDHVSSVAPRRPHALISAPISEEPKTLMRENNRAKTLGIPFLDLWTFTV